MSNTGRPTSSVTRDLIAYIQPHVGERNTKPAQDQLIEDFIREHQVDSTVEKLRQRLGHIANKHGKPGFSTIRSIFAQKMDIVIQGEWLRRQGLLGNMANTKEQPADLNELHQNVESGPQLSTAHAGNAVTRKRRANEGAETIPAKRQKASRCADAASSRPEVDGRHPPPSYADPSSSGPSEDDAADSDYEEDPMSKSKQKAAKVKPKKSTATSRRKPGTVPFSERSSAFHATATGGDGLATSSNQHTDRYRSNSTPSDSLRADAAVDDNVVQRQAPYASAMDSKSPIANTRAANEKKRHFDDATEAPPPKRIKSSAHDNANANTSQDGHPSTEDSQHSRAVVIEDSDAESPASPSSKLPEADTPAAEKTARAGQTLGALEQAHTGQQVEGSCPPATRPMRLNTRPVPSNTVGRIISVGRVGDLATSRRLIADDMEKMKQDCRTLVELYLKDRNIEPDEITPASLCYTDRVQLNETEAKLAALYEQLFGRKWRYKWEALKSAYRTEAWPYQASSVLKSLIAAAVFKYGLQNSDDRWNLAGHVRRLFGESLDSGEQLCDDGTPLVNLLNVATSRIYNSAEMEKEAAQTAEELVLQLVGVLRPHLDNYRCASEDAGGLRMDVLQRILERALLVKGKMDAHDRSDGILEFIWPSIGDAYDADTMSDGGISASADEKVVLTMWPGLKLIRKYGVSREVTIYDAQVVLA